jgi:hypothetical protein
VLLKFSCFFELSFSELVTSYARHLEKRHDMLLGMLFESGTYTKLYSYRHLINGFAVHLSPEQVMFLSLPSFFTITLLKIMSFEFLKSISAL